MKKIVLVSLTAIFLFSFKSDSFEKGMFPMSQLNSLDLKNAGLEISTNDIYNESKPALVNALVRMLVQLQSDLQHVLVVGRIVIHQSGRSR